MIGPHAAPGTYIITVTGTHGSQTHSATITVIVPSKTIAVPALTWTHTLSLSGSGGAEMWVATFQNMGSTAQYVQVVITGSSSGGRHPFTFQSAKVPVAAGTTVSITVSAPAGSFTAADLGLTFNFQARAFFGTSSSNLNQVSQDMPTGSFTVVS